MIFDKEYKISDSLIIRYPNLLSLFHKFIILSKWAGVLKVKLARP